MIDFTLSKANSVAHASQLASKAETAQQGAQVRFIAGGTTLVDLMKLDVETPQRVVDINRLGLAAIDRQPDGTLRIDAMVRNAELAHDTVVMKDYPVLSQALLSGASAQLRNMASTGGNLLQRTRCNYFRDLTFSACNKRTPGSGCSALEGHNRTHAILGGSEHCIATHPSDMAVAMTALEARIHIVNAQAGAKLERDVPIGDFYLLPGTTPHLENVLNPGDVITHVTLPAAAPGTRSVYLKLRDRASYEFALASAAVVIEAGDGHFRQARIALGGVGTRPWRSPEAEQALAGKPISESTFRAAADAALRHAHPHRDNAFKVELAKRCLIRALTTVTAQGA